MTNVTIKPGDTVTVLINGAPESYIVHGDGASPAELYLRPVPPLPNGYYYADAYADENGAKIGGRMYRYEDGAWAELKVYDQDLEPRDEPPVHDVTLLRGSDVHLKGTW